MAERLNSIAHSHLASASVRHHPPDHAPEFYSRAGSLSVSNADDLAAVNEFLVTLGRDVSSGGHNRQQVPHGDHGAQQPFTQDDFFNTESLSALGLSGMPGISVSHYPNDLAYSTSPTQPSAPYASFSSPLARSPHPSAQSNQYNSIYPSIYPTINPPVNYPSHEFVHGISPKYAPSPASILSYPSPHPQHLPSSTPDNGSPHSRHVTPSATPPLKVLAMPDSALIANFDYIRPSRGAAPVPQLAPVDYLGKSLRTIVSLKAAPRLDLPEPTSTRNTHKLSAILNPDNGGSTDKKPSALPPPPRLPPLATPLPGEDSDAPCRLPPLHQMYRSPTPSPTREPKSSSTTSSPSVNSRILPRLGSMSIAPVHHESERGRGHTSRDDPHQQQRQHRRLDEQQMDVDNIQLDRPPREISAEERRRHALLIRNLLISINNDYKRRFGSPASRNTSRVDSLSLGTSLRIATSEIRMSRDVEMSVA